MTQHMDIAESARLWAIRVQDSAFDDWDGFTAWLEGSPAHSAAYERALDDDAWAAALFADRPAEPPALQTFAEPIPSWDAQPAMRPRRRWYAMGGAIAAALVAVASYSLLDRTAPTEIFTAPGEHRTVPLADGSKIILNGGTRVLIDGDNPREVELASGEALFEVHHDESNPFVVTVGETRLLDAGTVFNVISDRGSLDVAVAEGAVIYGPGQEEIRLDAGDALSRASEKADLVLRKAAPMMVGGWRTGQLEYSNASLDQIARDLGRNLGKPIQPAAGAERLRFTGRLVISGGTDNVLRRVGPLLGVKFAADGDAWRMTPANGAPTN